MIYRMRTYQAVAENLPKFHDLFRDHLLPIHQRHGARLIGRWETEDSRVVAVWEYDDRTEYERIQAEVRADPDWAAAQRHRESLPPLYTDKKDVLMTSTVSDLWGVASNP